MTKVIGFLFALCIMASCSSEEPQNSMIPDALSPTPLQDELIVEIGANSMPLPDLPLSITDEKLSFLPSLSDARIIGLGEATHGTRQFFEMKTRLIQYFVEHMGFDGVIFEMDMAEALFINDYVQWRSHQDLEQLMSEKLIFWAWKSREVFNLFQWMRSYNEGKSTTDMLGIYGIDVQFSTYDADRIIELISVYDSTAAKELALYLLPYKNIQSYYSDGVTDSELSVIEGGIQKTIDYLVREEENLVNLYGQKKYELLQRLGLHMVQTAEVRRQGAFNNNFNSRDPLMAQNALWYQSYLGEDSKLVIWSHNGHVANDPDYTGLGSMGYHLRQSLHLEYQVIGFGFGKGSFLATHPADGLAIYSIDSEPPAGSSNYLFSQIAHDNFHVDLQMDEGILNNWFKNQRPFLSVGSFYTGSPEEFYREISLSQFYDHLIFFKNSDPASFL